VIIAQSREGFAPPKVTGGGLMETIEEFFDEDQVEIENMRSSRNKMKSKDFARLINKRELSKFEMDEIFM
jgi:hypothetical protein